MDQHSRFVRVTASLSDPLVRRLDALCDSGRFLSRSEAMRAALTIGLDALERSDDPRRARSSR